MSDFLKHIDLERIPRHVAIIMDGNGRWAKERGEDRLVGHREGIVSVRKIVEAATRLKVGYLTLYTFSTENWNRPAAEVEALMAILVESIARETERLHENNIRLTAIGDLKRMPAAVQAKLQECIDYTSGNTGMTLVLALSYSSQWEIVEMVKAVATEVQKGLLRVENITRETISAHLTTHSIPDPDLLIRTSGEVRISNFLLWQLAYTELYFTETKWPDFREEEFYKAIYEFQQRDRRFGKVK